MLTLRPVYSKTKKTVNKLLKKYICSPKSSPELGTRKGREHCGAGLDLGRIWDGIWEGSGIKLGRIQHSGVQKGSLKIAKYLGLTVTQKLIRAYWGIYC